MSMIKSLQPFKNVSDDSACSSRRASSHLTDEEIESSPYQRAASLNIQRPLMRSTGSSQITASAPAAESSPPEGPTPPKERTKRLSLLNPGSLVRQKTSEKDKSHTPSVAPADPLGVVVRLDPAPWREMGSIALVGILLAPFAWHMVMGGKAW